MLDACGVNFRAPFSNLKSSLACTKPLVYRGNIQFAKNLPFTGFSSEIGTKLRDWAVGQAGGSCYSRAALSSNDSKTLYTI